MTTPRGGTPLTKDTQNGHQVAPPRPRAKTAAKTAAKAPVMDAPVMDAPVKDAPVKAPVMDAPVKAPVKDAPVKAPAKAKAQAAEPAAGKGSPFDLLGRRETAGALRFLGQLAARYPGAVLRTTPALGQELVKIARGRSEVAPKKGDKRFADPAWQQNPLFRAAMQNYLIWGSGMESYIDNLGLTGIGADRLRFGASLVRESLAPTNFFVGNPAAVKRAYETGGGSVRRGLVNWLGDQRHNHGMPSMVDLKPFTKGETIAASPGSVIFRNEVFELIQYKPQHETVYERPILVVPPQVNKYYALDLSPGRSLFEYLLQRGIQVFGISWRNPTKEQRDWNFDTYVQATIDAIDVIREITGSPDVNVMGGCLGGMTSALTQAHLAALGEEDRINSTTMFVTLLDTNVKGPMFLFSSPQMLALAKLVSRPTGVIDGWQLGSTFAWLRPNDLVLELLGQQLPARPGPAGLRHPGLERRHHPAARRLAPADAGHGGRKPDGAPGRHDGPGHAHRPVPHHHRHVRGGRDDRPHHAVEGLLPDHPGGLRPRRVRAVLQRPHPDRGGRPEAPWPRVLPQPGHAARRG